jgi:hypothetical protein
MTSGDRPNSEPSPATIGLPLATVAQQIRDELKTRFGLTRRNVSVRTYPRNYRGEILAIFLFQPGLRVRQIERFVARHRYEQRCPHTGALLGTTNREIRVELDRAAYCAFECALFDRLWNLRPAGPEVFQPLRIGRFRFEVSREDCEFQTFFRRRGEPVGIAWDVGLMAQHLARVLAQSRHWRRLLDLAYTKES